MKTIPTAEEFIEDELRCYEKSHIKELLINFTRLHIEACKKEIIINAEAELELSNPYDPDSSYPIVNKDSILNSYPLDKIK